VQLFERSRRRVIATAAGERVIAAARIALQRMDDVAEAAQLAREPLLRPPSTSRSAALRTRAAVIALPPAPAPDRVA
jgi:DNA-binding transcriptional LysR family regulator